LVEIKGAELRRSIAEGTARERHHAVGFTDCVLGLLRKSGARLQARILVKGIGKPIDSHALYTASVQALCTGFQSALSRANDIGLVILDSRRKPQNTRVVHPVFTQKYKVAGDSYSRIVTSPTFGHASSHPVLQLTDIACSALLFPIAIQTYCTGHVTNLHVRPGYARMLAYRVETDLVRAIASPYPRSPDEGRTLVTAALQSSGDSR